MKDPNCLFCNIVEKKIPSKIVFEDNFNLAFLDIFPISKGHTIVIPKNHFENIEEIPDNELIKLFKEVKKIATNIHKTLGIDGYNILQNNFLAAGQVINHFHVHIIPRSENDARFTMKIPRNQTSDKNLENILKIIKI